jgi:tetratricopeptide (TPR) repeat protein
MFDTGLKRHQARQLTRDDALLHIDGQDRVWIPVEVTLLGGTFTEAWRVGAQVMRERPYEVVEIKEAWKKYAPLHLTGKGQPAVAPGREEIWTLFREDVRLQEQTLISGEARELQMKLRENPADRRALNSLGVLLAKNGYLRQAAEHFLRVVELLPAFPGGYSNLGNVLYEQERYEEAIDRYLEALRLVPESPGVNVELALTYCEVGKFDLAREHYRRAMGQPAEASTGLKAGH